MQNYDLLLIVIVTSLDKGVFMAQQPPVISVDLYQLRVERSKQSCQVVLVFTDSKGNQHRRRYTGPGFLRALNSLSDRDHDTRMAGVRLLGTTSPNSDAAWPHFHLQSDGRQWLNLGSEKGGCLDDLFLMLAEQSRRPQQIRDALRLKRPLVLER